MWGRGLGTDSYLVNPKRKMFLAVIVAELMGMVISSGIAPFSLLCASEIIQSFSLSWIVTAALGPVVLLGMAGFLLCLLVGPAAAWSPEWDPEDI